MKFYYKTHFILGYNLYQLDPTGIPYEHHSLHPPYGHHDRYQYNDLYCNGIQILMLN